MYQSGFRQEADFSLNSSNADIIMKGTLCRMVTVKRTIGDTEKCKDRPKWKLFTIPQVKGASGGSCVTRAH